MKKLFGTIALLRGGNGKNGSEGVHKNPQNMVYHKGRIYGTLEWGSWENGEYCHAAMVMSADENADLMNSEFSCAEQHSTVHIVSMTQTIPHFIELKTLEA